MTRTEFGRELKGLSVKGRLSLERLRALPAERRKAIAEHVVRHRGELLVDLAAAVDPGWLAAMGYLYRTRSKVAPEYEFVHLCGARIR
jgi:hypothetical protein